MKHKAQESLDYLKNEVVEKIDVDTIQHLINCQLTLDEMKFIANCLYVAGFVDENMVKQILDKFQKQKEMWVSDDETN